MTFKIEISQFYDYVKLNYGNKTKLNIFSGDRYKCGIIFYWS